MLSRNQLPGNRTTDQADQAKHRASAGQLSGPFTGRGEPNLDASAWERFRRGFAGVLGARALALRRVVAVACVLVAGLLALHPIAAGRASSQQTALVAARDLAPGHALAPDDVARREVPDELLPRGALRDPAALRGRALNSGARSGEVLTDARLAGQELAGDDEGRAAVPVRLADPAVAELLQPGQRVDVVATGSDPDTGSGSGSVLAERVPVISVRPTGSGRERDQLVVVRLPKQRASEVAAASVARSVTVILR